MKLTNRANKWTASLGIITTSALTASLVSAQVPPSHVENRGTRPLLQDKAGHDIYKAREGAFSVEYLAKQVSSQEAKDLTSTAQQVLQQAESSYKAGRYIKAEKQAKAAKALYEASEALYEAQLGYVVDSPISKALSQSYEEAPYKAQEHIYRAQVAMDYYQVKNAQVAQLISRAQELVGLTSSVTPVQYPETSDFAQLANSRAAEHLAKAVIHLIEAERANGL